MQNYEIQSGDWARLAVDAKPIREQVFIQEQHISPEDEWDAQDAIALHFVVYLAGQAVATARLLENHSIGRVAVLKSQRGLGLGRVLMQHIIQLARQQYRPEVKLSAQVHAIPFYQSLGFYVEGESYLDCGIPHVDMRLVFES
ncbi:MULTISPECIES: GNAT family N-acetyltransferase [Acinetobacter]|uniref:GNAT family N-acetyltransferase n=1 Tax=Acinetobacter TaxID=469 RepID=UPI001445708C|nr:MULTISPECIES: GNAT family N-acetyltransferase [Acinetobacter]MDM1487294.1 GNAT family N-acetyltransferase [Acinetobacter towneri]